MQLPWQHVAAAAASLLVCALVLTLRDLLGVGSVVKVLIALLSAHCTVWFIATTFIYPFLLSPLRDLPQPAGKHWLLGHAPRLVRDTPGTALREWVTTMEHDGLLRYLFFFNRERLVVTSPAALKEVLVTKSYLFRKPEAMSVTLVEILGRGLLLAEGDEHKAQRKKLMPAFHYRHVKDLHPLFVSKARDVVRAMTAACGPNRLAVLEVNSWASRCTLDIIGLAGMGVDFGAIRDEANPLAAAYRNVATPKRQTRLLMAAGMFMPGWLLKSLPVQRNSDVKVAARQIRAVCHDLIRGKQAKLAGGGGGGGEPTDLDIVSVALESGHFTDEELVDQLMTFLAAGHDTTASALTWAAYFLARFPDKQRRLRDEVRSLLPSLFDDGRAVESTDIDRLPYLHAFCNEVLRYFSPVPMTIRESVADTTVQGHFVPRGTRLVLSPWAINVDPARWGADARAFKPERWLASPSGGADSNYAFMTFLHGPRSCIGAAFARAEFACLLAAWAGRFHFELDDPALLDERNLDFKTAVTARPANGMHLRTTVLDLC